MYLVALKLLLFMIIYKSKGFAGRINNIIIRIIPIEVKDVKKYSGKSTTFLLLQKYSSIVSFGKDLIFSVL
jgi:hypothetical protein